MQFFDFTSEYLKVPMGSFSIFLKKIFPLPVAPSKKSTGKPYRTCASPHKTRPNCNMPWRRRLARAKFLQMNLIPGFPRELQCDSKSQLGFACLMLRKNCKIIIPNGGLIVICPWYNPLKVILNKSKIEWCYQKKVNDGHDKNATRYLVLLESWYNNGPGTVVHRFILGYAVVQLRSSMVYWGQKSHLQLVELLTIGISKFSQGTTP